MKAKPATFGRTRDRLQLVRAIGRGVSRFQEASYGFDDVAAEILALNRSDLPCVTLLLFDGPAAADQLAATLHLPRAVVTATLERMQLAGYARFQPGGGSRIELTEHARKWIERIWADLRREGGRVLDGYPTRDLMLISTFLRQASEIQESRTNKLKVWLALPSSPARRSHLRGGLSPAALRRVQWFVEANLHGLSIFTISPPARRSVRTTSRAPSRPPQARHRALSSRTGGSSARSAYFAARLNRWPPSPLKQASERKAG